MSLSFEKISIVHWFSEVEKHKCGYCKNENGSVSNGMWAETMSVDDYQMLIDRGWRRSGKYCYKPIMEETCCPQYAIRCEALKFKPSKSQKKVIKKVNKYINTDCNIKDAETVTDKAEMVDECSENFVFKEKPKSSFNYEELKDGLSSCDNLENQSELPCSSSDADKHSGVSLKVNEISKMEVDNQKITCPINVVKKGVGADPNKPPSKKAKLLRLEKKQEKQNTLNISKPNVNKEKSLEELISEISAEPKHKLKTKLVPCVELEDSLEQNVRKEFELYYKYQTTVHNDPPEKITTQSFTRFLVTTPLKIKLVRMNSESDDFQANFELTSRLYAKYQIFCHKEREDECNQSVYHDFLVETPIQYKKTDPNFVGFGSYHQQYWLDDKLIAVGVIDILPKCISSVYFFYDPDYRNLTLGTYGSLRELEFTRSLHKTMPSIEYYYMGFYIHSCPKMRYKGKLAESKLLCPETYVWFPFDETTAKLDKKKYVRFNQDKDALDDDACDYEDILSIKVLQNNRYSFFKNYKNKASDRFYRGLITMGKLVGRNCSKNLLVIVNSD